MMLESHGKGGIPALLRTTTDRRLCLLLSQLLVSVQLANFMKDFTQENRPLLLSKFYFLFLFILLFIYVNSVLNFHFHVNSLTLGLCHNKAKLGYCPDVFLMLVEWLCGYCPDVFLMLVAWLFSLPLVILQVLRPRSVTVHYVVFSSAGDSTDAGIQKCHRQLCCSSSLLHIR